MAGCLSGQPAEAYRFGAPARNAAFGRGLPPQQSQTARHVADRIVGNRHPGTEVALDALIDAIAFDAQGLIAAIAQQHDTGDVLMLGWMKMQALRATLASGEATYFSRSRQRLWRKGETSGQVQQVLSLRPDCDGDAVLLLVDQQGAACHTGRRSCFHLQIEGESVVRDAPIIDPRLLYPKD